MKTVAEQRKACVCTSCDRNRVGVGNVMEELVPEDRVDCILQPAIVLCIQTRRQVVQRQGLLTLDGAPTRCW